MVRPRIKEPGSTRVAIYSQMPPAPVYPGTATAAQRRESHTNYPAISSIPNHVSVCFVWRQDTYYNRIIQHPSSALSFPLCRTITFAGALTLELLPRRVMLLARSSILSSLDALAGTSSSRPHVQLLVRTARHSTSNNNRLSSLPAPPPLSILETSKDAAAARDWLMRFRRCPIPRAAVDLAFSRSSGPGGQNVNKVNTKATLRCALDSTWIPSWARDALRESPFFVKSTRSILLTSTLHRTQAQNVDDCLSKLHALICSAASQQIKNDPSEEQRERVRELGRRADAQRRLQKDKRSQTKRQRANSNLNWD